MFVFNNYDSCDIIYMVLILEVYALMFEIYIEDHFDSAHSLRGYDGPCKHVHGHTYKVSATFKFETCDDTGIAFDFVKAKHALKELVNILDHAYLNELEVFETKNPTAENIAYYVYSEIKKEIGELASVSIWETATSCATYYE